MQGFEAWVAGTCKLEAKSLALRNMGFTHALHFSELGFTKHRQCTATSKRGKKGFGTLARNVAVYHFYVTGAAVSKLRLWF